MRTVAAVILDLLARKGVTKAFGIPGVHNLGFWNALSKDRPEIISVRHEQSCVYAADGLARATGTLSVAITTTGPGAANTLGAFGQGEFCMRCGIKVQSLHHLLNECPSVAKN